MFTVLRGLLVVVCCLLIAVWCCLLVVVWFCQWFVFSLFVVLCGIRCSLSVVGAWRLVAVDVDCCADVRCLLFVVFVCSSFSVACCCCVLFGVCCSLLCVVRCCALLAVPCFVFGA